MNRIKQLESQLKLTKPEVYDQVPYENFRPLEPSISCGDLAIQARPDIGHLAVQTDSDVVSIASTVGSVASYVSCPSTLMR